MTPTTLETIVDTIGWLMLAIGIVSLLYPWSPHQSFSSKLIHLPLLLIPLWIAYEILMPAHMNIRADLLFIPPFIILTMVIWAIKVARFRKLKRKTVGKDAPSRKD